VLFLIDEVQGTAAGGTERQLFQNIIALSQAGFSVELAILRSAAGISSDFPVHALEFPQKLFSPAGLAAMRRLRNWISKSRFDIVQTFFTDSNLIGPVIAKKAGTRVVIGSRRNLNHWMSSNYARFQRLSNRFADRLIANSEVVKEVVIRTEHAPAAKIDVLYNGIDVPRFERRPEVRRRLRTELNLSDGTVVVGNVANLRPVKGVEELLEAAAIVVKRISNVRFLQAGQGELHDVVQRRMKELELEANFTLLGRRDDVQDLLSAFDIGVLTSRAEGFSNSVLEYMAAGLPIVVTDVGGNREALAETGTIVPPRNVQAIADALIEFAIDPAKRNSLGNAALTRVRENFSNDAIQQKLVAYYQRLLQ
jgi:glycosyltransferase involved in cell wall biosynthesis